MTSRRRHPLDGRVDTQVAVERGRGAQLELDLDDGRPEVLVPQPQQDSPEPQVVEPVGVAEVAEVDPDQMAMFPAVATAADVAAAQPLRKLAADDEPVTIGQARVREGDADRAVTNVRDRVECWASLTPGVPVHRAALLIPVLCAVAVLAACSSEIAGTPTPAAPVSPEDAYIAAIMDTPGLASTVPRAELLRVGRSICDAIGTPGLSSAQMREELGKAKWGPQVSLVVINAAETHLCPTKYYVPSLEFAPVAPAPVTIVGPTTLPAAASFSAGTYEVGTGPGEIPPGKYKSPGPTSGGSCYYSRLKNNDGAYDDIIGNNLTEGPSVMTVQASDGYVEISGCTFTKA